MERKKSAWWDGQALTLIGPELKVGQKAPEFTALANDLSPVHLADGRGKTRLLCSIPSVDTPICDAETRRFNQEAAQLGESVQILIVSMDLPFALSRYCAVAGIDRAKTLSDHAGASFGQAYGVLIKELRLLSRAIFVVDPKDTLQHVEYVLEAGDPPNYSAALNALKTIYL